MEVSLKFGFVQDKITAGEEILGEVEIDNSEIIEDCRLEITLKGKECIKLRTIEENSLKCQDYHTKRVFCKEECSFPLNNIDISRHIINFRLKTNSLHPGAFFLSHFNDSAKIFYKLKAKLYSGNKYLLKESMPIMIFSNILLSSTHEFAIHSKKCCINYGAIAVIAEINKLS